jgi:hypothetical protein
MCVNRISLTQGSITGLNWSLNERHELSWSTSDGSTSDGSANLLSLLAFFLTSICTEICIKHS